HQQFGPKGFTLTGFTEYVLPVPDLGLPFTTKLVYESVSENLYFLEEQPFSYVLDEPIYVYQGDQLLISASISEIEINDVRVNDMPWQFDEEDQSIIVPLQMAWGMLTVDIDVTHNREQQTYRLTLHTR